MPIFYMKIILE